MCIRDRDAQLRWKEGRNSMNFGAYYTRFSNFIGLFDTGAEFEIEPGEFLPIAQFRASCAVFKGIEFDGKFGLSDNLDLTVRGDYVHAKDKSNNEYLPRIAPLRLGAGLQYKLGNFSARLDALHAFKPVSYTHLDVYKRQALTPLCIRICCATALPRMCCNPAVIYAPCKRCWGMPTSAPRRCTRISISSI